MDGPVGPHHAYVDRVGLTTGQRLGERLRHHGPVVGVHVGQVVVVAPGRQHLGVAEHLVVEQGPRGGVGRHVQVPPADARGLEHEADRLVEGLKVSDPTVFGAHAGILVRLLGGRGSRGVPQLALDGTSGRPQPALAG